MLLNAGDKILVSHRRLFERDEMRFFLGTVDVYEAGLVKATGRSYVRDKVSGTIVENPDRRTKILSLSSGSLFVYQLPREVSLEALQFASDDGRLAVGDGRGFSMILSEATHEGRL